MMTDESVQLSENAMDVYDEYQFSIPDRRRCNQAHHTAMAIGTLLFSIIKMQTPHKGNITLTKTQNTSLHIPLNHPV